MEIYLKNIAKIGEARIKVDKIAVIAGQNSTGKSTVGKALFALVGALSGLGDDEILRNRVITIKRAVYRVLEERQLPFLMLDAEQDEYDSPEYYMAKKLGAAIHESLRNQPEISEEKIRGLVGSVLSDSCSNDAIDESVQNEIVTELSMKIIDILSLSSDLFVRNRVTSSFRNIFNNQINSLFSEERNKQGRVNLRIKDKLVSAVFERDMCVETEREILITSNAIGVDDVNGDLTVQVNSYFKDRKNRHLNDGFDDVARSVKLDEIISKLGEVIAGSFVIDSRYACIKFDDLIKPLNVSNLSDGLKTFAIVKTLVENNIKERDFLILDEPEVHLHPEWQIKYAEIIVLMQKLLNLSIVVTTHSPYFVEALDLYSRKHEISSGVNYYASRVDSHGVGYIEDIEGKIEKIYQQMVDPIALLTELRVSLDSNI